MGEVCVDSHPHRGRGEGFVNTRKLMRNEANICSSLYDVGEIPEEWSTEALWRMLRFYVKIDLVNIKSNIKWHPFY